MTDAECQEALDQGLEVVAIGYSMSFKLTGFFKDILGCKFWKRINGSAFPSYSLMLVLSTGPRECRLVSR